MLELGGGKPPFLTLEAFGPDRCQVSFRLLKNFFHACQESSNMQSIHQGMVYLDRNWQQNAVALLYNFPNAIFGTESSRPQLRACAKLVNDTQGKVVK